MHEPNRDHLENVLATHFAALRAPAEMEPAAGFYGRVMQRIEEQGSCSFWSFFAESPLSKGLAIASLAISLALGSYMFSQERSEHHRAGVGVLAVDSRLHHYDALVVGSPEQQRDAVLENFAVHAGPETQGRVQ